MSGNIYLVGFMAAGKTTIGQMLGLELGREFFDLDRCVERRAGCSIDEIFRRDGEAAFRNIEQQLFREVARMDNAVIALGGGSYVDPANRAIARATGTAIFLDTPLRQLVERLRSHEDRPLAAGTPADLDSLLQSRMPAYLEADIHIAAGGMPAQVLDTVLRALAALEPVP